MCEKCEARAKATREQQTAASQSQAYQRLMIAAAEQGDGKGVDEFREKALEAAGRAMDHLVAVAKISVDHGSGSILDILRGG
jgi:hypothetical protein